ncbi:ACP S-malonyltransferase [Parasedimentitalea maritima]|uniref:[acyl-carrier-protein] S-malonyltransferase n=1 Tax=Parasedimentitalea maritima TaxID=2578117 RepID=A0ABY2UPS6_9RHOB|nr:ACP S-malonyltransferase [Zongyanglinia marina]TLP56843.1 ACP S-malonyltransferase [Zongyanglinia marina]
MTRTAVLICPGRGTYNKTELGYLNRYHADKAELLSGFDQLRGLGGQDPVIELDRAAKFSMAKYSRGDVASPLIYASAVADAQSLSDDIEVVAVTGNSMGWYIALAVAGALASNDGFHVVNTMGTLMQQHLIGGQLVYPFVDENWLPKPHLKDELLALIARINGENGQTLSLSIDLGGMLVLAGNEAGLQGFEQAVPVLQERFPMRLPNHAAFHTHLQTPVAELGRQLLPESLFCQPNVALIDGRGQTWWPGACDTQVLWDYTLGQQVVQPYNFTLAVQAAAQEFAPDLFIVTGPGTTLGGAVAQSLVLGGWQNMASKHDFKSRQADRSTLISMGDPEQRNWVTSCDNIE